MPLGMEVGLRPRDFALDADTAPPQKGGGALQIFGPCLLWPAGWIRMPLGREVDLGPGDIMLYGDPAPLPNFWLMSVVA